MRSLQPAVKNRMSTVSFCRYVSAAVRRPNLPPPADQVLKLKLLSTTLEIVQTYTHHNTQYNGNQGGNKAQIQEEWKTRSEAVRNCSANSMPRAALSGSPWRWFPRDWACGALQGPGKRQRVKALSWSNGMERSRCREMLWHKLTNRYCAPLTCQNGWEES